MQVSLANIKGTGPDGRIVKADIEDYLGRYLWLWLCGLMPSELFSYFTQINCFITNLQLLVLEFI